MAPLASQPGLTVTQGLQLPTPKLLPPKSQLAEQWDNVGRELGKLGEAQAGRGPEDQVSGGGAIWDGSSFPSFKAFC